MTAVYIAKYLKKLFLDFNDNKNGVIDLFIETIKRKTSLLFNDSNAIRRQEEYRLQHNTSKTFEEHICENAMLL